MMGWWMLNYWRLCGIHIATHPTICIWLQGRFSNEKWPKWFRLVNSQIGETLQSLCSQILHSAMVLYRLCANNFGDKTANFAKLCKDWYQSNCKERPEIPRKSFNWKSSKNTNYVQHQSRITSQCFWLVGQSTSRACKKFANVQILGFAIGICAKISLIKFW